MRHNSTAETIVAIGSVFYKTEEKFMRFCPVQG